MVALQRVERWLLAGIGLAFLGFVGYLIWPRVIGPPQYLAYADIRLQIYGFRRRSAFSPFYENRRKENVSVWPGRWTPHPHSPGYVGVAPGWITIRFRTPPQRGKLVWHRLTPKKNRSSVVRVRTIVLGKP